MRILAVLLVLPFAGCLDTVEGLFEEPACPVGQALEADVVVHSRPFVALLPDGSPTTPEPLRFTARDGDFVAVTALVGVGQGAAAFRFTTPEGTAMHAGPRFEWNGTALAGDYALAVVGSPVALDGTFSAGLVWHGCRDV